MFCFFPEKEVLINSWWLAVKIMRWRGSMNALSLRAPVLGALLIQTSHGGHKGQGYTRQALFFTTKVHLPIYVTFTCIVKKNVVVDESAISC